MKESDLIFGLMAAFGKQEYAIADFLHLLTPFNVAESSLRTNLSRMTQKGIIVSRREGRKSYYRFADKGGRVRSNIGFSFNSPDWSDWDRSWWGIVFSVPETQKPKRHAIRKKLTAYRFVSLYPGFWIRPYNQREGIELALQTVFESIHCRTIRFHPLQEFTRNEVAILWKLDEIIRECSRGLALLKEKLAELPGCTPEQALVEKMEVGGEVVPILFLDPLLPPEFLPENWHMDDLRQAFWEWDRAASAASKPYWEHIFT